MTTGSGDPSFRICRTMAGHTLTSIGYLKNRSEIWGSETCSEIVLKKSKSTNVFKNLNFTTN